ncbi:MAG: hypothetical protein ACKOHN_09880 [Actinomycetota bacterium]
MFLYGVVNASPDSLNTDSIALDATAATRRAEYLLANACYGIDLGGHVITDKDNFVQCKQESERIETIVN